MDVPYQSHNPPRPLHRELEMNPHPLRPLPTAVTPLGLNF